MKKRRKLFTILFCINVLMISLISVYTTPSKWLPLLDSEVVSIIVTDLKYSQSVTINDTNEIKEIITLINKTHTKKRIIYPDEEYFMGPDSGYIITAIDSKNQFTSTIYDNHKSGLVCGNSIVQNVSFDNLELYELLSRYFLY